jgi:hypothetical protein
MNTRLIFWENAAPPECVPNSPYIISFPIDVIEPVNIAF